MVDTDSEAPGIVELEDGTFQRQMTTCFDPDDGDRVEVLTALEEYLERCDLIPPYPPRSNMYFCWSSLN